ncbi:MAG: ring-cleaving dioxygenase [Pseudomonadota bacterium]
MTTTTSPIQGLHHVTAISTSAQGNVDFYAGVLGLRFVKKTVNFDDPGTYHLYFGDELGRPGSAITFFPWENAYRGQVGTGQVSITHYSVPEGSLGFWRERLSAHGARVIAEETIFGEDRLVAADPDGLLIALVATADDEREAWTTDEITADVAIRGFHGATLSLRDGEGVAKILTELFGYEKLAEETARVGVVIRFAVPNGNAARVIDLHVGDELPQGVEGAGTVHHIAFSVPDRAAQKQVQETVAKAGFHVTPQIDRDYFHAIYFRTPGGVLFEVATDEPGFTRDEEARHLGEGLKLPTQHEPLRSRIEQVLPKLTVPGAAA